MLSRFRKRFSSAHVLAAMALFVALGGSAYAVKKNSVGTKQIKNAAVKEAKLADAAVSTAKLADGAATGAKVDEASLGKVPSAATADSAATAATAGSADTAASAQNSETLAGQGLSQVRTLAGHVGDNTSQGLDDATFEQVMTRAVAIPSGGADIAVNASIELSSNAGGQAGGQCELRSEGVAISETATVTLSSGHSEMIPLVGFVDGAAETTPGDPENVAVFCQGSISDDDVQFVNGDLVTQRIPTGD